MIDPTVIQISESWNLDGPGFEAQLVRLRERSWVMSRGIDPNRREIAKLELIGEERWVVTAANDPEAARFFDDSDAASRRDLVGDVARDYVEGARVGDHEIVGSGAELLDLLPRLDATPDAFEAAGMIAAEWDQLQEA